MSRLTGTQTMNRACSSTGSGPGFGLSLQRSWAASYRVVPRWTNSAKGGEGGTPRVARSWWCHRASRVAGAAGPGRAVGCVLGAGWWCGHVTEYDGAQRLTVTREVWGWGWCESAGPGGVVAVGGVPGGCPPLVVARARAGGAWWAAR